MKKNTFAVFLALAFSAFSIHAQTSCKQTTEQIANDFASAFTEKKLDTLDANRGVVGKITLTIENSLSGKLTVKTFANLKAIEKWLTKREIDELPGRIANELVSCKKGVCSFKIDGLSHSTIFLKKISFGYTKNKCPFIKTIYIVDGV
jgi:hypothetical protein